MKQRKIIRIISSCVAFLFANHRRILLVSSQEELEEFYDDLQTEMRHKKTHYNVIMGDFNAKVGKGDEDCVGSFGYGVRNDRGDDLINFATAHGFKIMNTYYKKKKN